MTEPPVICPYCKQPAVLVDGSVVYPHRPDLKHKRFWNCAPCKAFVGCHAPNNGYGDGTRPLGRLANSTLRQAKSRVHAAFDPLWKDGSMRRHFAYTWLAREMGIPLDECHIGMFDLAMCEKAITIIERRKADVQGT